MSEERYKQLMEQVGFPNSASLLGALQQVANETAQEYAALEAELARLRDLTRLRPMSEAKPGVVVLCVRDSDEMISGKPSPWVPGEMACVGQAFPKDDLFGWLPLPEVHEDPAPDAEHYHE